MKNSHGGVQSQTTCTTNFDNTKNPYRNQLSTHWCATTDKHKEDTDMTTTQPMNKLARAKELTRAMREHEQRIVAMNNERRELLREMWKDDGLRQREIAVELGVTSQTIWNEIHRKDHTQQV